MTRLGTIAVRSVSGTGRGRSSGDAGACRHVGGRWQGESVPARTTVDEETTVSTSLNPYLNFRSNAKDALAFYASVLGGELATSTFGEAGMSQSPRTPT